MQDPFIAKLLESEVGRMKMLGTRSESLLVSEAAAGAEADADRRPAAEAAASLETERQERERLAGEAARRRTSAE